MMDLSKLNFDMGKVFSSKVLNSLGVQVSPSVQTGRVFFLLVSFSRNRFRLSEESFGFCLQSVLGGSALDFAVLQLEEQIFRFYVTSNHVSFMVAWCSSFPRLPKSISSWHSC
jgi:hypothetical protein